MPESTEQYFHICLVIVIVFVIVFVCCPLILRQVSRNQYFCQYPQSMVAIPFPTISLALKTQKDCKREGGSPEDSQWKDCGGNSAQQTAQKTRQKWSLQELGFAMKLYEDYQWTLLIEHNAVRENIAHWFLHWKGNTICTLTSSATVHCARRHFKLCRLSSCSHFSLSPIQPHPADG